MVIAAVSNTVSDVAQTGVNFGRNVSNQAGRCFSALSNGMKDLDTTLMFAKAGDAFATLSKQCNFGEVSFHASYKNAVDGLSGWQAFMNLPETLQDTAAKVVQVFVDRSCYALASSISAITGLANTAYDAVEFLEKHVGAPMCEGMSALFETRNFQALAVGAGTRIALAAERVISSLMGRAGTSVEVGVSNTLEFVQNAGDLGFAVTMLTSRDPLALATASSVSAASKICNYVLKEAV